MRSLILSIILCIIFSFNVSAYDQSQLLDEQLDNIGLEQLDTVINNGKYFEGSSFKDIVEEIITGDKAFSFEEILKSIFKETINEFKAQSFFIRNFIIIGIFSALIRILNDSFKSDTAETAFYISYIIIVGILFSSFSQTISIVQETIENISVIMKVALPIMTGLLIMSGNTSSAYMFNPVILFCTEVLSDVIKNVIVPFISVCAVLQIVNSLSQKEILNKFAELIKNCISWSIKGIACIFAAVLSIQKLSAPLLNNTINKTAKSVINMVPVVGDVFTGSVESILYLCSAVKNGVGIALIVIIVISCAFSVIKIIAIIFMYKFIAALIQPICDKRISDCIDSMGGYTSLLLSALVSVIVMFVFSVLIIISCVAI